METSSWSLTQVDTVERGGLQALRSQRAAATADLGGGGRPEGQDVPRPSVVFTSQQVARWAVKVH